MSDKAHLNLSRRERQIMDVVYRLGRASATEVLDGLPEPPGYSAVRAMLRILEEKGHLRHEIEGTRYVYLPTLSRARARRSALEGLLQTYFDGSAEQAMAALLDVSRADLDPGDLDRFAALIEQARKEGR